MKLVGFIYIVLLILGTLFIIRDHMRNRIWGSPITITKGYIINSLILILTTIPGWFMLDELIVKIRNK